MLNILNSLIRNFLNCRVVHQMATMAISMALTLGSAAAQAGEISATSSEYRTPVVELYTSEGCSSCPPADKWITKLGDTLSADFHAVPLAFHVDYWNRLGWPDPFSSSEFTNRQRKLAANNLQRSIYTPEFLVSGIEAKGTNAVVRGIQLANSELSKVDIMLDVDASQGDALNTELVINNQADNAVLYLAVFENDIVREIGGGENRGRTLHHDFVVRHWQKVATLAKGEHKGQYSIGLGEDWERGNIGLAAIVFDRYNGKTLQSVSTGLAKVFDLES